MKQRKPLQRRTPLRAKRLPPRPAKVYEVHTPRARTQAVAVVDTRAQLVVPMPKDKPLQHPGYMALVRGLACARCGWFRKGWMQFCHADINSGPGSKGIGLKSDCRLGYSGCGPHDGLPGCHYDIGTGAAMNKVERHAFEARAGAETRTAILDAGLWPARLHLWYGMPAAAMQAQP